VQTHFGRNEMTHKRGTKPELYIPKSQDDFIESMAVAGREKAGEYSYLLPEMIACTYNESGFDSSTVYKLTSSPFN
jgi:hypothetical protein